MEMIGENLGVVPDSDAVKVCSRKDCQHDGKAQPTSNFHRNRHSADGLCCACKTCLCADSQHRRLADPVKPSRWGREWREAHPDYFRNRYWIDPKHGREWQIKNWACAKTRQAKYRAKTLGLPFDLEPCDLLPLPEFCPVFGIRLDYKAGSKRSAWASLDRVKPALGYVKGNVRVISMAANMAKLDDCVDLIRRRPAKSSEHIPKQRGLFGELFA